LLSSIEAQSVFNMLVRVYFNSGLQYSNMRLFGQLTDAKPSAERTYPSFADLNDKWALGGILGGVNKHFATVHLDQPLF
jgi:hypothetical protein